MDIQRRSTNRILLEIPNFDYFANLLHERLHAILYYYEEWDSKLMLLTTLYDRDPKRIAERSKETPDDVEALIYCGTERQRIILEKNTPEYLIKQLENVGKKWDKAQWELERDANWEVLSNRIMDRTMPDVQTFPYFNKFRTQELAFGDVEVESLKDYFSKDLNLLKENEQPIMSDYFDIEKDKYIGIPLLGMGLFQGIVWLVFKDEEAARFDDPKFVRRVIKYFQVEYDNLVLDWDVTGENIKEASKVDQVFQNLEEDNPIQEEIKLKKYYDILEFYHRERIRQSNDVVQTLKAQFAKTAIITTLLDSYAHNISAHSLTTLSWWFKEWAEYLDENYGGKKIVEMLGRDTNPLIKLHHHQQQQQHALSEDNSLKLVYNDQNEFGQGSNPFITGINTISKLSTATYSSKKQLLSRELATLFKFLLEKGAFWSGITRQTNFTGKVSSLYSVLWYDFVNNPLYLGTIANTEQVRKLYINISIYEEEEQTKEYTFENTKHIKKNATGKFLDGTFAIVNLDDFQIKSPQKGELPERAFVEKGDCYDILAPELQEQKAFFPGGVVGKHAFFTLIENEIRNVKHFKDESLETIRSQGLVLNISIHSRPVDSNNSQKNKKSELLKIGVWLKHKIDITPDLLFTRVKTLDLDIITEETFQPRLGGNQQDKLCASMLLTKTFDRAQDNQSALGDIYYPWIKSVKTTPSSQLGEVKEIEVSYRHYKKMEQRDLTVAFASIKGPGYFKKYFHLWQGDEIMTVDHIVNLQQPELESYSRFRFLNLTGAALKQKEDYQRSGIIRLLSEENKNITNVYEAYLNWLNKWLLPEDITTDPTLVIDIIEGCSQACRLLYTGSEAQFKDTDTIMEEFFDDTLEAAYRAIPNRMTLMIEHGSHLTAAANKLNIRSHGELVKRFGQGKFPSALKQMSPIDVCELIEALGTRICLFDRRVYNRMVDPESERRTLQEARLKSMQKSLRLSINNEVEAIWAKEQSIGFIGRFNFLVIHLSFIEGIIMRGGQGKKYSEETILQFIDDQILQGLPPENVPENFILVITTGRGRMAWWETVSAEPAYARFTTFRPIESILGAVEDALQILDEIDLKINLTKLLFGS